MLKVLMIIMAVVISMNLIYNLAWSIHEVRQIEQIEKSLKFIDKGLREVNVNLRNYRKALELIGKDDRYDS